MAFSFHYPSKAAASVSWVPENGPVFPLSFPVDYPGQIVLRSGDNTLHVQEQGKIRKTVSLNFVNSSADDVSSYGNFFETVRRSFYSFEYEDLESTLYTVKIMNGFNFRKTGVKTYSGSVELEIE